MKHKLYDYLIANGAKPFWADAAATHISLALNNSFHFSHDESNPRVWFFQGRPKTFTFETSLNNGSGSKRVKVSYTFRPTLKKAHQIKIKPA